MVEAAVDVVGARRDREGDRRERHGKDDARGMARGEPVQEKVLALSRGDLEFLGAENRGHLVGVKADARCKVVALADVNSQAAEAMNDEEARSAFGLAPGWAVLILLASGAMVGGCLGWNLWRGNRP